MAGIDNNTLLYLRGDSFKDLSIYKNTSLINQETSVIENEWINLNSKYFTVNYSDMISFKSSTTIELDFILNSSSGVQVFFSKGHIHNQSIPDYQLSYKTNKFELQIGTGSGTSSADISYSNEHPIDFGKKYKIALVYDGGYGYLVFLDGKLIINHKSAYKPSSSKNLYFGNRQSLDQTSQLSISNIRISDVERYTNDYTPRVEPFNSIHINIANKTLDKVDFNISKLGQETINKVEIIQNDEVKETFTDSYDNLAFNHNGESLKVVVTYDDIYTEELDVPIGNGKAKIWLYKEGNECTTITGGWSRQEVANRVPKIMGNIDNKLYIDGSSDEYGVLKTSNKITLENISDFITFDVECNITPSTYAFTQLMTNKNNDFYNVSVEIFHTYTSSCSRELRTLRGNIKDMYVGFATNHYTKNETSIYNVYTETKEDVVSISSQDNSSINFSCNTFNDLISITKAEVFINNKLSKTFEEGFNDLTYYFNNESSGSFNVDIRVTYSQGDGITKSSVKSFSNSIYQNSKAKIYLYKEGNECETITGGILTGINSGNLLDLIKNPTNISTSYSSGDRHVCVRTNNKITSNIPFKLFSDVTVTGGHSTKGVKKYKLYAEDEPMIGIDNTNDTANPYVADVSKKMCIEDLSLESGKYIGVYCGYVTGSIQNIYLETEVGIICIKSKGNSSLSFGVSDLNGLISISKAEVYVNNVLSKTCYDNFDNITYNIDDNLCGFDYNKIAIRVYYSQGDGIVEFTEEEVPHYIENNNRLDINSSSSQIANVRDRVSKTINSHKILLKNILESKNIRVSDDEYKLSKLIDKVELLNGIEQVNDILYLYKSGDEYPNITGGWTYYQGSSTLNKTGDYMDVRINNNSNKESDVSIFGTNSLIDLSPFSKLSIEYVNTNTTTSSDIRSIIFSACNSKEYKSTKYATYLGDVNYIQKTDHIITLDISGINESAYITTSGSAGKSGGRNIKIYRIWLEK